ncbi:DUF4911 domain-containing protein [Desulfogranum japonicum]|uniref:DUF4911 domain-containing protein n=1 Tax=Desulfogranum japonicum TaxID=231447 RepID=UPI0004124657|nr:DUF4911 domain-containing protein [Desulfogranum japonicum]
METLTPPKAVRIYLRIRPSQISWLKFIVEAYDGLALLSTVSVSEGLVTLWTLEHSIRELFALLGELAGNLTPYSTGALQTSCLE